MDDTLKMVDEFHQAFEIVTPHCPTLPGVDSPGAKLLLGMYGERMKRLSVEMMSEAKRRSDGPDGMLFLRLHLCLEELSELAEAMSKKDIVGCLDALCDMRYVADGTTLALGLEGAWGAAFREVHRSNMSKLDAEGRPVKNEAGRVIKGPEYSPPDLVKILTGGGDDCSDRTAPRS